MDKSTRDFYLSRYKWREVSGDKKARHVLTGPVRLAFAYLDPASPKKSKPRKDGSVPPATWAATPVVPVGADMSPLLKVISEVGTARFGADLMARKDEYGKPVLSLPVKRQARLNEKYPTSFGKDGFYFDASSQFAPPVVDMAGKDVVFPNPAIYSGMWALVRVRVYTFDAESNKGVSLGLVSVQKLADDEEWTGKSGGTDEFGAIEAHPGMAGATGGAVTPPAADAYAAMLAGA